MERTIELVITDCQLETIVDIYNETCDDKENVDTIQDFQIAEVINKLIDDQV